METLPPMLAQVIGVKVDDVTGDETQVLAVDVVASRMRQSITQLLKVVDPTAYKKYRELKYSEGEDPSLEKRKEAYKFAFSCLIEATYRYVNI